MRKAIVVCGTAALLALLFAVTGTHADTPTTGGGMTRVQHDTSLMGSGTTSNTLKIRTDCSSTQVLKWDGDSWECGAAGAGTVTNVSTVAPLQGGPITSTGSISLVSCATNEIYKWNGTAFACAADADTTYSSSAPISLAGTVFGLTACAANEIYKENGTGTGWVCSADAGTTYSAGTSMSLAGTVFDVASRDFGDITTSSTGSVWTIDNSAVTLAKMADVSTDVFLGRTTALTGVVEAMTPTQATALLDTFTSSTSGVVSASGGGSTNFARADGTWAAPPGLQTGSGTANTLAMWTGTNALGNSLITQITTNLIQLDGSGTTGGVTAKVGGNFFKVNTTGGGDALTITGTQITFHNGATDSYLCYAGGADDYIRACGSTGVIYIGDSGTGGVELGLAANPTKVKGDLFVNHSGTGHAYYSGTAPTLGGCTGQCTMRADSTDERGTITCSDSNGTACSVTFAAGFTTNAPACWVTTTAATYPKFTVAPTTGTFSFHRNAADTGTNTFMFGCDGTL